MQPRCKNLGAKGRTGAKAPGGGPAPGSRTLGVREGPVPQPLAIPVPVPIPGVLSGGTVAR